MNEKFIYYVHSVKPVTWNELLSTNWPKIIIIISTMEIDLEQISTVSSAAQSHKRKIHLILSILVEVNLSKIT